MGEKMTRPLCFLTTLLLFVIFIWTCRSVFFAKSAESQNENLPITHMTFVSALADFPDTFEPCSKAYSCHVALHMWAKEYENVLILGDNEHVCNALKNLNLPNVKCIVHKCTHANEGKPILSCLLRTAESQTTTDSIAFSNSDLIYRGMKQAAQIATAYFDDAFLIVGRRLDIEFSELCKSLPHYYSSNVSPKHASSFLEILKANGTYHNEYGIDYFLFKRGSLPLQEMPDFVIGAWKWDTWLLDTMTRKRIAPVIDGTDAIDAIHLQTTKKVHEERAGSDHNRILFEKYYQKNGTIPMDYGHLINDPYPAGYGTTAFAPFKVSKKRILTQWCYLNLGMSSCNDPIPVR